MNTKNRRVVCIGLAILLVAALFGCHKTTTDKVLPDDLVKNIYKMDLTLDEAAKKLNGHLDVTYSNVTGTELSVVPFSVFPNAYLAKSTAPFSLSDMDEAYPNGFSAGGLAIDALSVDGTTAAYALGNDDKTLLSVTLPTRLAAGKSALISFDFTVTLPNSAGRFGYGDKSFNLCNFYPIACSYEGSKFLTYPYVERGDPFVSDMADYSVTLRVPTGMKVASTGTSTMNTQNGYDVYSIAAPNVRDFAAVCSRHFVIKTQQVSYEGTDTLVQAYTYDDASFGTTESLEYGVAAVKVFTDKIGTYPYKQFSVVQTDFFIGGMEYPNIVLIDKGLYEENSADTLEFVIVHETGHQWFYAMVGNDQVNEPWLDEALTEYITICYYGYRYGASAQKIMLNDYEKQNYLYCKNYHGIPSAEDHVGLPTTAYSDDYIYSAVVYSHGTMMLSELAQKVGQEKLLKALSVYFKTYAGKRATKSQLFEVLNRETGYDCLSFCQSWL